MMNAASSHVTGSTIYNLGEVSPGETFCNVILIAPVGSGNLTIGYNKIPGDNHQLPPGMNDSVTVPVHLKVTNPANKTVLEEDIVTPGTFQMEFSARGEYKVYLTNNGNQRTSIPIGTTFEMGNPQNREADKYLLALFLTVTGVVCISAGVIIGLISKRFTKKTKPKSIEKQAWSSTS
jgi:hypothetical protein